jgi:hypothetical protein
MDSAPKRPGRPRTTAPKEPTRVQKLGKQAGRAGRIIVSLSDAQRQKLARMAQAQGITESEKIRRLIDAAEE